MKRLVEGRTSPLCSALALRIYGATGSKAVRTAVRRWVLLLEGGPGFSNTIRKLLRNFYKIDIGLYSSWPHRLKPSVFHPGTTIGRYATVADTFRTFTRNHTTSTKSTHGFFDNPVLKLVDSDLIPWGTLEIGHGAWIGHNSLVLPPTTHIGDGAVITPGSVVYSNVPPYAIMSGFPARVVGYRFDKELIAGLIESRWWEKSSAELAGENEPVAALRARLAKAQAGVDGVGQNLGVSTGLRVSGGAL